MRTSGLILFLAFLFASCGNDKRRVDMILHHGNVYTADGGFAVLESFAVKDGKIVAVGTNESIAALYEADSSLDAQGKTVLPGLIDAHCHFVGYGLGLQDCNLTGTKSFDEVIARVKEYAKTTKREWILGRGWDQNDWAVKEYPDRSMLDSLFPHTPVVLKRVDGHAALVNGEALRRAKIKGTTTVNGGELLLRQDIGQESNVLLDRENEQALTGILIDNAVDLVEKVIPRPDFNVTRDALLTAQQNYFAVGITTVDDAGLMKDKVDIIDTLQKRGELKMRVYAMMSDSLPNYLYYLPHGPYKTDYLNVRSFKFYGDGSLGSRGACLLEPYSDQPGWKGFLLSTPQHYEDKMKLLAQKNFQVCTHCIGDSANRFMLSLYHRLMPDSSKRWRIEHAQVVSAQDVPLFGAYGVIASVQPVHATSDMYWADKRLGAERVKTAYAYNDLLKSSGMLAFGTDAPVENINPMYTFYAAVVRKDLSHFPPGGYQTANAVDRRTALLAMTRWAAYANFEENEKGSIEAGKFADFIIVDTDPMTCAEDSIPKINVLATYVGGQKVYERK